MNRVLAAYFPSNTVVSGPSFSWVPENQDTAPWRTPNILLESKIIRRSVLDSRIESPRDPQNLPGCDEIGQSHVALFWS